MSEINALPEALELWNNPDEMLDMWDNSDSKQRHELLVAKLVGMCRSVVDLGCGVGRLVPALELDVEYGAVGEYMGYDASTAMIQRALRKYIGVQNVKFAVVDIFEYVSDTAYDVAIMLDVAQHQDDPVGSIQRMFQLWRAERYVFSLLVGNTYERLLNSTVVAWSDIFPILLEHNVTCMHVEPSPDGSPFAWVLMEVVSSGYK